MRCVHIWVWRPSGNGLTLPSCVLLLHFSGSFRLHTLFAHQLLQGQSLPTRQMAWYTKTLPTFSDTLADVRQHLWPVTLSYLSPAKADIVEIPRALFERFIQTLAFAA